jgi:asparagine synthase (glutamine-hydrolysing)
LNLSHEILQEENIMPFAGPAAELTPEPTPEPFFDRIRGVYQSIATHARIVLSGDGGDDVLNGQAWPYLQYLWGKAEWGTIANHFGGYFVAHGRLPPLRGGFRSKLRPWFLPKQSPSKTPPWLNEDFAKRSIRTAHESSADPAAIPQHPVHPQAYKSLHSGYWASVLESEDAGWTRVNLETRAPLLDLRILRFLLRLPPVPWCMNKQLSRKAMKTLLPEEILKRPKAPLLQDPLEACQQKTNWHPAPEKRPPELVLEFVKWEQWLETLETQRGSLSWDTLSPLSFSLWLKSIENKRRIQ